MTHEIFFTPERLSEIVGEPVTASRLRWKPGLSTQALLKNADGIFGWAQAVAPPHLVKVEKAIRRATRFGLNVTVKPIPDTDHTLVFGPPETDPGLVKGFNELRERGLESAESELVRFNPARRAVLRSTLEGAPVAIRLTSDAGETKRGHRRAKQLVAAGITTVEPLEKGKYLSLWPWVGEADLADERGDQRRRLATLAGRELAAVHELPLSDAVHVADVMGALRAQVDDMAFLDHSLARKAEAVIDRCRWPDKAHVVAHGDFSADQIATSVEQVWLLDFDRIQALPAEMDVASFHAYELLSGRAPATDALIAGLGSVTFDDIAPYVAIALGQRMFEPFRAADPRWREATAVRLDQMEEWLQ